MHKNSLSRDDKKATHQGPYSSRIVRRGAPATYQEDMALLPKSSRHSSQHDEEKQKTTDQTEQNLATELPSTSVNPPHIETKVVIANSAESSTAVPSSTISAATAESQDNAKGANDIGIMTDGPLFTLDIPPLLLTTKSQLEYGL